MQAFKRPVGMRRMPLPAARFGARAGLCAVARRRRRAGRRADGLQTPEKVTRTRLSHRLSKPRESCRCHFVLAVII
eukprot:6190955-Pleurochrysis_carterae.AAC.3